MKEYSTALTIAGSDSGGGAGIQADLKAFSANGCYGMSAVTAITAQNTIGVTAIHPIPVNVLTAQLDAVLSDIGANAVKIGMLHSSEVIHTVIKAIKKYEITNLVIDPVMVATSGDKLLQDEAIQSLRNDLLPLASVITPNIPEAEILLDRKILEQNDLILAAKDLAKIGCKSVLLKAGHFSDDVLIDIFYDAENDKIVELSSKRCESKNTHGTGCTLSSAIAAHLAQGNDLETSVKKGKKYLAEALVSGAEYKIGKGHGPVNHFYK